jgi:D-alanyl-D-alanine carboxypeptidase
MMRKAPGFLFFVVGALASASAAQPPNNIVEKVRARAEAQHFDGTILIGEADGSSASFSLGPSPISRNAVWRWASITKQLTAVIAMQEVAAGRFDLDAPVSRYWPDWTAPNAGKIRIRDLMLHNSGLPQPDDSAPDKDGVPGFYRANAASPAAGAARFCAGPARATPPAKFDYNNCDSIVLAEVLARVTGKPFDVLVRDPLWPPGACASEADWRVQRRRRTAQPRCLRCRRRCLRDDR